MAHIRMRQTFTSPKGVFIIYQRGVRTGEKLSYSPWWQKYLHKDGTKIYRQNLSSEKLPLVAKNGSHKDETNFHIT